ncbi:MAG TPA: YebC/PmpR family DNA-binding transcriptional regulator [Candidatus Paceibacterota bacterium]|nr:YebC/PmpR family DNA-binding transcriptional regulator [Candidatus Paceibacterota bacterium]
MAGHSKWAQIKRQKAVTDAAKSRTFSRFARLITIEAKKAGGNLSSPSLASAIERAKAVNMPKDNIERAIQKGASKDAAALEQVVYEFYGPGGTALIVDALTDNKNRTTQEIKHLLSKNGFELGGQGSALWAFSKSGDGTLAPNEPLADLSEADEEALGRLLELFDEHEDVQQVYTNARGYESTRD